jgi:hypothetical protein
LDRLQEQVNRYRAAAEATLDTLDYCIDAFQQEHRTRGFARHLRRNQKAIRQRMAGES